MLSVGHADGKAGEILLRGLNIAAVGKIIAAVFADHCNAFGNIILCSIQPVMLAGQKKRINFAGFQQRMVFFKIFHDNFSFFPMR